MSKTKKFIKASTILFLLLQVSGTWSDDEGRIVNGYDENIENAPYLVQLYFGDEFKCAGTLITDSLVVTAAHCTNPFVAEDLPLEQFFVKAGATKLSDTGVSTTVAEIKEHEEFDKVAPYDMDIAVLKLKEPLKGALIKPTNLCSRKTQIRGPVKVFGWGKTNEKSFSLSTDQLQAVDLNVVTRSRCRKVFRNYHIGDQLSQITESMFCAAAPGKDSCSGDSGGPVLVGGEFCGIVSWSNGCAKPGYPGVYTNLISSDVRRFITEAMKM